VNHPTASQGEAFSWTTFIGKPIDRPYAERRALNEPLTEISNASFDHDSQPKASPQDAWLAFRTLGETDAPGFGGNVRDGIGRSLEAQRRLGVNPFHLGVVVTSDNHVGQTSQDDIRLAPQPAKFEGARDSFDEFHSSVTGVWAEHNTRESIFAALRRREVFAMTGLRISVRFFGGWALPPSLFTKSDWVKAAYAQGAPMGGTLSARPLEAKAPRFVVWARRAPEGEALERAQIVKLTLVGDKYRETLFEVAGKGDRCDDGFALVWEDPSFDPSALAVYYLRVLQEATPRRKTLFGSSPDLMPADWPATTQERSWSSPIWYCPEVR
jgi:hypothetical protein